MSRTPDPNAAACVYFDGSCPVCSREIALYERLGAGKTDKPDFVNIAAAGFPDLPDLDQRAALARLHVRRQDGTLVSGAAAFIALWRATPRFRLLGRIAAIPPLPFLLEWAYRGFLKIRPLWR